MAWAPWELEKQPGAEEPGQGASYHYFSEDGFLDSPGKPRTPAGFPSNVPQQQPRLRLAVKTRSESELQTPNSASEHVIGSAWVTCPCSPNQESGSQEGEHGCLHPPSVWPTRSFQRLSSPQEESAYQ